MHAAYWLGYADDLVIMATSEKAAQDTLHHFVGSFVNVSKTECMAVGVSNAEIQKRDAIKERVRVRWDHAEYDGWLIDWSGRSGYIDEQVLSTINLSVSKTAHLRICLFMMMANFLQSY